jgi:hypothetical protein
VRVDRTKTARLIDLLHAQRTEAEHRSGQVRGSRAWIESSARLDELNNQIMHLGTLGSPTREVIAADLEVDLDSRPVDDGPFRRHVVDSLRHVLRLVNQELLAEHAIGRLTASAERIERTQSLIERAEAELRDRYPSARLAETEPEDAGTLCLRADRDARVA